MQNKLLQQTEETIEKTVSEEDKEAYDRIMVAGMKVLFSQKTHGALIAKLKESENPIEDTGKGAVGLIVTLWNESKGTMPVKAMIPAGLTLMLHALDYLDSTGAVAIDKQELDQATEVFIETLMPQMGLTPERVQELTGGVQEVMADPEKMKQYKGA